MSNKQLFEEYIMQNVDSAYRFAYTYTKNREDAEDVVNESVIKALKSIGSLKNPQYIKSWFYKIIIHTALTGKKKKSKIIYLQPEDLEAVTEEESDYSSITIHSMICGLKPKYKSIIVLRFLEEMSLHEISQTLDLNENTVKTRLYTALKLLRKEMEEDQYAGYE